MKHLIGLGYAAIGVILATGLIYLLGCLSLLVSNEVVLAALNKMNY